MLCRVTVALCFLLSVKSLALAQSQSQPDNPPTPESASTMDPPMVGDHWTYEVHDEITGALRNTNTSTITDVTPAEIAVRGQTLGNPNFGEYIYDHSWNIINSPLWKFSPNDGSGIKLPMTVGSSWKFQNNQINTQHGITFKRSGSSKVVAQESVTTSAGTFDAFKVETTVEIRNVNDPSKKSVNETTLWYAPAVDHVVRQSVKVSANGHVDQRVSIELVDYGRR